MPHTIPACPHCGHEPMCPGDDSLVCPGSAGDRPKAIARAMLLKSAFVKDA